MIKILDFLGLLLYCGFIYWLSSRSSLPTPSWFEYQDKLFHFGAYFMLGLLTWRSFKHLLNHPIILILASIAFCSLYGASDEWHQSFVVGRSSDVLDWLADTSGAAVGVFLWDKLRKSRQFQ